MKHKEDKFAYFMWFPGECDTDEKVRSMSDEEFGFYVRCLNHAWINKGLPVEIAAFAKTMGKTPKKLLRLWAQVSQCFSENSEKRFINSRQELQRSELQDFRIRRSETSKSMWANKSKIQMDSKSTPDGLQLDSINTYTNTYTNTVLKTLSSETASDAIISEPKPPESNPIETWFNEEFWPIWIKRTDDVKGGALKASKAKAKTIAIRAAIIAAVHEHKAARTAKDPQYRVSATKWLREEHWLSKPEAVSTTVEDPRIVMRMINGEMVRDITATQVTGIYRPFSEYKPQPRGTGPGIFEEMQEYMAKKRVG